jgi:hypothetical protein
VTDGPACGTSTLHLKILDKQSHAAHQCRLRWTIVHEWSYKPSTTFWIRFHRHAFMHALRRQQAGVTNQATQQGRILSSFATGPCIARALNSGTPRPGPHTVSVCTSHYSNHIIQEPSHKCWLEPHRSSSFFELLLELGKANACSWDRR